MAAAITYASNPAIQQSFDLLCEYLNFGDDYTTGAAGLVRHILCSSYIRPFFEEYTRDHLMLAEEIEDIEYGALQSLCEKKHVFISKAYASRRPGNKAGWTAVDHAARFMVQTLQHSWRKNGPWGHGVWDVDSDESDIEFWQVW